MKFVRFSKHLCLCLIVILAMPVIFHGQYNLRQKKGMETTDDPRRVPIRPRDRSKDPIIVLKGGTLIDGTGSKPLPNAVLVIQGDLILDAGPADKITIPDKVKRAIDVTGLYIVPGLIDLHMHFTQQRGEDMGMYRDSDAAAAIRGVEKRA